MSILAQEAADCGVFDLECKSAGLIQSALDELVIRITEAAAELIVAATSWWAQTDSVDPMDPAVLAAQGQTQLLVLVILVVSVLVQAIRIILSRKAEPLIQVAGGLLRFALVSALGLVVLQAGLRAGDELSRVVLDNAANNFAVLMVDNLTYQEGIKNNFSYVLIGIVAAVLAALQWCLMLGRQAGLLVLAAMLPLAASGSINRATRGWLGRLLPWLIAIAVYKPAAALIYFIGFTYLTTTSSNQPGEVTTMLAGLVVLALALVAMPALMRFFSWSGTQIGGQGLVGGSQMLGAVGAAAALPMRSRAVHRAATQSAAGPGSRNARPQGSSGSAGRSPRMVITVSPVPTGTGDQKPNKRKGDS
ncbi:hypothetical protein [Pseudonocardia xishanensis]|uniref:TrbL/VirB6 plasmid conjugal transfer protein n=1 Tax=Pseudonocardia xishanensis TaxID=630995 RepID=A0ABP8S3V0_9PSEU